MLPVTLLAVVLGMQVGAPLTGGAFICKGFASLCQVQLANASCQNWAEVISEARECALTFASCPAGSVLRGSIDIKVLSQQVISVFIYFLETVFNQ